MKLTTVCDKLNISATVTYGGTVPEGWTPGTNPWKVTLRKGRKRLTVPFFTGPGCSGEPTAADVLSCIVSDVNAGEQTFKGFCSDFGYDADSRKAEQTYKACAKIAPKVRAFLGDDFDKVQEAEH